MIHPDSCQVVELRRYALRPHQRDTLIELFDREFVETQEAVGMCLLGQFRDLDDPDSFIWMRGFVDMPSRQKALEAFYTGPAWKEHAQAANATMLDSDNVLLLRPISQLELDIADRPAPGTTTAARGLFAVTILPLVPDKADEVPALYQRVLEPVLRQAGIAVIGSYITDRSKNTFPALPVREDREVLVWMSTFEDENDYTRRTSALDNSPDWSSAVQTLRSHLLEGIEVLRLHPTTRSALHA
jgi:quinol monooxygenase YgiN